MRTDDLAGPMKGSWPIRNGFALAVAIFALVVIGGLVASAFFASTQDYRLGRNTLFQERALAISEYGLHQVVEHWSAAMMTELPVGSTVPPVSYALSAQSGGNDGVDRATVRITRLSDLLFLVVSEGQAGNGVLTDARHRTSLTLKLAVPKIDLRGALTVRGSVRVSEGALIDASDADPPSWSCDTLRDSLPAVAALDAARVNASDCPNCVDGRPPVASDVRAGNDSTYFEYGDATWSDLAGAANIRLSAEHYPSPVTDANGSCRTSDPSNWGDPFRSVTGRGGCESYYPIIHSPGNLTVQGGRGQGILLVDGNLDVSGGFEFFGPVIVRGTLTTGPGGAVIYGGVMLYDASANTSDVQSGAAIRYSSCAVAAATIGSALPMPAAQRAWADLY